MPEPLKKLFNEELINSLCKGIKEAYAKFDSESFRESVFDSEWDNRELKERIKHISITLNKFLPNDYGTAIKILKKASLGSGGFENMFFSGYVEIYGLEEYDISISALEHFTIDSSPEFAVRPFIIKYPDRMMAQMEKWAESGNFHVRRLASEGCRPRLPWAMALRDFKKDPTPVLKILKKLKNDESEYVRRSVANNLNDISKDNPQLVVDIATKWLGENRNTDRLVKHACRTLLKQGNHEILDLFGLVKPDHIILDEFIIQEFVNMGEHLEFSFILNTQKSKLGKIRIEYGIDFLKKNGKLSRKLFKISESDYNLKKKVITKRHSFKNITTRKYYPGIHGLAIIVNGHEMAMDKFALEENP